MLTRFVASIIMVVLSSAPLIAQVQHGAESASSPSTKTEVFWNEAPTLVPIRLVLPPNSVSDRHHTLIVALHGWGSSSEEFLRVGLRLAEKGFLVALPESTYSFVSEEGNLGFDWTLYHTGDSELDKKAYQLLVTKYMPQVLNAINKRYSVDRTYVLGFSQGAIVAVLTSIAMCDSIDGVITFGLAAYDPAWLQDPALASGRASRQHLSILLLHGEQDERVPLAVSEQAREHLAGEGYEVKFRPYPGGHTVPSDQLEAVANWIRSIPQQ